MSVLYLAKIFTRVFRTFVTIIYIFIKMGDFSSRFLNILMLFYWGIKYSAFCLITCLNG